jgi:tetratricopeptide (TPR) repeat protein
MSRACHGSRHCDADLTFPAAAAGFNFHRMSSRFRAPLLGLLLVAVTALAGPAPGFAQRGEWVEPPKELPRAQRGDRTRNLDTLFEALKVAPDESSAKEIEQRIWALWLVSDSDTANLLMTRVKAAVDGKDIDLAIQLLDAIIEIKPDYAEAWNRRATLFFLKKEIGRSIADIQHVLALEPRHFGALSGLGTILQDLGDEKRALEIYRRALAIHPRLPKIPDTIKTLSEKVEGRDI